LSDANLISIENQLSKFQQYAESIERYGPEVAATSEWGFSDWRFFGPLITSDGIAAIHLDCQTRILKLSREPFSTALTQVATIASAPPLSRDIVCRIFADGIFSSLVHYELQTALRQLARSAINVELAVRAQRDSPPPLLADRRFILEQEEGKLFPRPIQFESVDDECVSLKLEIPARALELAWTSESRSRSMYLELSRWKVCKKPGDLDGLRVLAQSPDSPPPPVSTAS
jgi:hypothetical protein